MLVLLFLLPMVAHAEDAAAEFELETIRATRTAMAILAGWSAMNLVGGTALSLVEDDPVTRAFHQMNAGWNLVNAGLAVSGLLGVRRDQRAYPSGRSVEEIAERKNRLEDILLFNAGIDVGYMMTGVYLIERSRRGEPNADQLQGFGRSLIMQGGFLFAFDLAAYLVFRRVAPGS